MGEISITKLLVVAALVVLLFGTKKLRTLGGDLGTAIKGFKKAMNDEDAGVKKDVDGSVQAENSRTKSNSAMRLLRRVKTGKLPVFCLKCKRLLHDHFTSMPLTWRSAWYEERTKGPQAAWVKPIARASAFISSNSSGLT